MYLYTSTEHNHVWKGSAFRKWSGMEVPRKKRPRKQLQQCKWPRRSAWRDERPSIGPWARGVQKLQAARGVHAKIASFPILSERGFNWSMMFSPPSNSVLLVLFHNHNGTLWNEEISIKRTAFTAPKCHVCVHYTLLNQDTAWSRVSGFERFHCTCI